MDTAVFEHHDITLRERERTFSSKSVKTTIRSRKNKIIRTKRAEKRNKKHSGGVRNFEGKRKKRRKETYQNTGGKEAAFFFFLFLSTYVILV